MQNTIFKTLPNRQLPPQYDAKGAIDFVKKLVPMLLENSHWLVLVDRDSDMRFKELSEVLEAQFDTCAVPNLPGASMRFCAKLKLDGELYLGVLRDGFPDTSINGAPPQNWVTCMAWAQRSREALDRIANMLLSIAEKEQQQPGSGFQAAEQSFLKIAQQIEYARAAHLNRSRKRTAISHALKDHAA